MFKALCVLQLFYTEYVNCRWVINNILTQWYYFVCRLYPSHWAPRYRSLQDWCSLTPIGSGRRPDSSCTPSVWSLEAKALWREHEDYIISTVAQKKIQSSALFSLLPHLSAWMQLQECDIYYLSCIKPSHWLGWCLWCWSLLPRAHTER